MNAYVRESALTPASELTFTCEPMSRFQAQPPQERRAYRRPLSVRVGVIAAVALLQIGLIAALAKTHITAPPPPPVALSLIDVQQPEKAEPLPAPKVPVIATQVTVPMINLPEIVAAPDAITPPPPMPVTLTPSAAPTGDGGRAVLLNYQTELLRHLARHKTYPAIARARHAQGVSLVRFTMDRGGNVLSVALAKSSGVESLDGESIALVRRATPLPAAPPEVRGNPIELVVPIEFSLR